MTKAVLSLLGTCALLFTLPACEQHPSSQIKRFLDAHKKGAAPSHIETNAPEVEGFRPHNVSHPNMRTGPGSVRHEGM